MAKTYVKNKKSLPLSETFHNIASTITAIFVFVLLVVFPLYTHDMYFDILGARYVFFKITVAILMVLLLIVGIIYFIVDSRSGLHEKPTVIRFVEALKIENLHKYVNWCDVFFLLMIVSMTIGTLGAHKIRTFDLLTEAFYGNAGRYQGLECWIMYLVLYVCISRTYRFKKWHLDFALITCVLASLWSITDFYMMDIFGFLRNVSELQKHQFSSSVGNLNTLTNYTCMGFGVALTLFVLEENIWKTIFYVICSVICLCGNIFGMSDNAAIGTAVVYVCIPFFAVKYRREFIRYIFAIAILFLGLNIGYIGSNLPNAAGGWSLNSVLFDMSKISALRYLFFVFLIIGIALIVLYRKKKLTNEQMVLYTSPYDVPVYKHFGKIWSGLVIFGFLFVVYVFIDVNILHIFNDQILNILSPVRNFLTFDDNWGTHRGHNWRIAFSNFARFNPFHKIFGYGADTYLVITERTFYEEMVNRYGEVYD
ncbi:MAG: O-antigen ligase family protein, partial [Methanobacteriaceae archaeon]|nr:O-antigen ligase family protein [Methanobacteriaceae archaeon]